MGEGRDQSGLGGARISVIRGHPRLDEAIRHAARGALDLAREPGGLGRLYRDNGSHMIMVIALAEHFTKPGLTAMRFKALCHEAGLGSPGRAGALAAQLLDRGGLVEVRSSRDRREHRLRPTPELLAFIQARIRVDVEAAALVQPGVAEALARFDEPAFHPTYYAAVARTMRQHGRRLGVLEPELALFFDRTAGTLVLLDLLVSVPEWPPGVVAPVSVSDWSGRLGVSRSHLLKLLRDADGAGLIAWRSAEHEAVLSGRLIEAVRDFFAFFLFGIAFVLFDALRDQPRPAGT
ncbi:AraC-like DNA-binding protein [Caulobacter ginsengisoli]|uniref:AraC-like DNA-binding protein n=1 Tax=Caulobacter ginsengisoli TaxID=400775 RepID=A0ABU0ILM6_9CAUL|nr:hypothetical protein [Caulobacter ginsengisoli]MDQ0462925.1 AraC-like DNA-binding protein [Caulobacter ginsengisoli]